MAAMVDYAYFPRLQAGSPEPFQNAAAAAAAAAAAVAAC